MDAPRTWLTRRWQEPAHPLYLCLVFQAVVLVVVLVVEEPYAAAAFVGGTIGCLIASLRLQRQKRADPAL